MRFYNEDCIDRLAKMESEGERVDIVFTSPPYNRLKNDMYKNYVDKLSYEDYYNLLVNFTEKCLAISNRNVIVNLQETYYNREIINKYIGHFFDRMVHKIIWVKTNPRPVANHNEEGYCMINAYEFFFVLRQNGNVLKSNTKYLKNVIYSNVNSENEYKDVHSAVMKQDIADWFIKNFSKKGETVLDPFMGLGTTGVSCKKFERDFVGIELNKEYFELAKKRISNTDKPSKELADFFI